MPSSVEVRPARADDVDGLVPVVRDYLAFYGVERDDAAVRAHLVDRTGDGSAVVEVAVRDGRVVGFALAYPTWDTLELASRWILHDLHVLGPHRRGGIGRRLLRAVVEAAGRAGACAVTLETAHTNAPAQALYESEGFVLDREFRTYVRQIPA